MAPTSEDDAALTTAEPTHNVRRRRYVTWGALLAALTLVAAMSPLVTRHRHPSRGG